jgi:class 3 adenylate cyclase
LSSAAARLGLKLRAGLHTGEVEARGEDISGIAVNAAARIVRSERSARFRRR